MTRTIGAKAGASFYALERRCRRKPIILSKVVGAGYRKSETKLRIAQTHGAIPDISIFQLGKACPCAGSPVARAPFIQRHPKESRQEGTISGSPSPANRRSFSKAMRANVGKRAWIHVAALSEPTDNRPVGNLSRECLSDPRPPDKRSKSSQLP